MTDLIERLRWLHPIEPSNIIAVCEEAANEIDRLTAENKNLKQDIGFLHLTFREAAAALTDYMDRTPEADD